MNADTLITQISQASEKGYLTPSKDELLLTTLALILGQLEDIAESLESISSSVYVPPGARK